MGNRIRQNDCKFVPTTRWQRMVPVTHRIYCKSLDLIREGLEAMIGLMSEERAKKEGEYSSLGEQ